MKAFVFSLLGVAVLGLHGCKAPADDPQCDGVVKIAVTSTTPSLVSTDLLIRGTVSSTSMTAIQSLSALGVAARNDGFNFDQWSVTLPISTLLASLPTSEAGGAGGASGVVDIPIVATQSCGDPGKTTLVVNVDPLPGIKVDTLTLQTKFAPSRTYLPADGSASIIVTVEGNPAARGAVVTLTATSGGVLEQGVSSVALTLAGDGVSPAMASTLLTGNAPGPVLLAASAKGVNATQVSIPVLGAPRILPSASSLGPGQSIHVVIDHGSGQGVSCQASAQTGISVTSKDVSLSAVPSSVEEFDVKVAADLSEPVSASVVCRDDYGQLASSSYAGVPKL